MEDPQLPPPAVELRRGLVPRVFNDDGGDARAGAGSATTSAAGAAAADPREILRREEEIHRWTCLAREAGWEADVAQAMAVADAVRVEKETKNCGCLGAILSSIYLRTAPCSPLRFSGRHCMKTSALTTCVHLSSLPDGGLTDAFETIFFNYSGAEVAEQAKIVQERAAAEGERGSPGCFLCLGAAVEGAGSRQRVRQAGGREQRGGPVPRGHHRMEAKTKVGGGNGRE